MFNDTQYSEVTNYIYIFSQFYAWFEFITFTACCKVTVYSIRIWKHGKLKGSLLEL